MSKKLNRFLIVDAAEETSTQFSRIAQRLGYATNVAVMLDKFVDSMQGFDPSVVMLDLQSVAQGGIDYLKAMRDHGSKARLILTSENDSRALETATQLAEFMGLTVVASLRTSIFVNVLRDELRKARVSRTDVKLDDVKKAIKAGDIRPYYQPNAALANPGDWSIAEVEVQPRWHVSDARVLMPEDFLWLAEDAGLLPEITMSLLHAVLDQCSQWQQRRINLGVVVNLPACVLADRNFPDELSQMVKARKLEPASLTLEVTEASVMNYSSSVVEVLGRLKSMGYRLSIDEFGTSYSSLEQLCRLKFDELKIDRSLIRESRASSEARVIIEATILLAHKLGLTVCAEGVDSQRTAQFLCRVGCDKAQGKAFSEPLTREMLETQLSNWDQSAAAS